MGKEIKRVPIDHHFSQIKDAKNDGSNTKIHERTTRWGCAWPTERTGAPIVDVSPRFTSNKIESIPPPSSSKEEEEESQVVLPAKRNDSPAVIFRFQVDDDGHGRHQYVHPFDPFSFYSLVHRLPVSRRRAMTPQRTRTWDQCRHQLPSRVDWRRTK